MTGFLALVSAVLLLQYARAANPPGQEHGGISFYYDKTINYFVAATGSTCFMLPLTVEEQDHVHTNKGMEDLELRMMREWVGVLPETRVYHDDTHLPDLIKHWCSRRDIFILERNMAAVTTHQSPLASISP